MDYIKQLDETQQKENERSGSENTTPDVSVVPINVGKQLYVNVDDVWYLCEIVSVKDETFDIIYISQQRFDSTNPERKTGFVRSDFRFKKPKDNSVKYFQFTSEYE